MKKSTKEGTLAEFELRNFGGGGKGMLSDYIILKTKTKKGIKIIQ
jgi:hypothetical protein